jgi:hypothetical protein
MQNPVIARTELRHPLANHRAGQPRGRIYHGYFGGYYWMRLPNASLTAVYRPTGDGPQDFQVAIMIGGHSHRKMLKVAAPR